MSHQHHHMCFSHQRFTVIESACLETSGPTHIILCGEAGAAEALAPVSRMGLSSLSYICYTLPMRNSIAQCYHRSSWRRAGAWPGPQWWSTPVSGDA